MTKRAPHLPATQARFEALADKREAQRQQPGGTGRTAGVRLSPAVARGAGVNSRRQSSPQSLDGVGARVPNVIGNKQPPGTGGDKSGPLKRSPALRKKG